MLGEANCVRGLGDIAGAARRIDEARVRYGEALVLYGRIPQPALMGSTYRLLAFLSATAAERRRHVDAARQLWTQIDRPDLVAELDREFGT